MAADDKTTVKGSAPARRPARDPEVAAPADEAAPRRSPLGRPALTRSELERLRARLQEKFH
jgi:hypothetical protein